LVCRHYRYPPSPWSLPALSAPDIEAPPRRCPIASNRANAATGGAVYGQIAGAYYGYQGIPREWKAKLSHRDLIEAYANQLYRLGAE